MDAEGMVRLALAGAHAGGPLDKSSTLHVQGPILDIWTLHPSIMIHSYSV
jgi:hypothetical protein